MKFIIEVFACLGLIFMGVLGYTIWNLHNLTCDEATVKLKAYMMCNVSPSCHLSLDHMADAIELMEFVRQCNRIPEEVD